jgi:hypothetical protein
MLLEVPLSMMAWMGVVLIQAIVHFGIIGPRRRTEELPGELELDRSFQLDEGEDPPEDFQKLLSQTGDEVISVSGAALKCMTITHFQVLKNVFRSHLCHSIILKHQCIRSNSFIERQARAQLERDKEE